MRTGNASADYRYKHIELALARLFDISLEDAPAFRARLRHLRELGVPDLPKPGSGQQISYTQDHAVQLLLALELEAVGIPPRLAAASAKSLSRGRGFYASVAKASDIYVVIAPGADLAKDRSPNISVVPGYKFEHIERNIRENRRLTLINMSQSIRALEAELIRQAAG
jgi:hypothetical protein